MSAGVPWWNAPMGGFDLETTGLDFATSRIVTAATVAWYPGQELLSTHRVCDPGIEVPETAARIHGYTRQRAAAEATNEAAELIELVIGELQRWCEDGVPIVGMNLSYDFTILDRLARRYGLRTLSERLMASIGRDISFVIDILVIDRHVRPLYYPNGNKRRDGRKLGQMAVDYGVPLTDAHNSAADVAASMRIAWKLGNRYPQLNMPVAELHEAQRGWHAQWCGEATRGFIDPSWPLHPYVEPVPAEPFPLWTDATDAEAAAVGALAKNFKIDKVAELT